MKFIYYLLITSTFFIHQIQSSDNTYLISNGGSSSALGYIAVYDSSTNNSARY